MSTASMGHQAKLATSASGAVTQPFEYVSNSVRRVGQLVVRNGLRGTREQNAADAKDGPYAVSGTLILQPTPEDLAIWLPRILGAAADGNTFALAETLPEFELSEDKIAKVYTWSDCKVDRATFRGTKGGLLELSLDIEGLSESIGNAGTFPSLTLAYTRAYIFHELVATLASQAREIESFELVINNNLVKDRWLNSQTRISLPEGDREITLQTVVPAVAGNTDLHNLGATGTNGTLVFTSGNYSTTFTFGKLQAPTEGPPTNGPTEIFYTNNWQVRKTGSTASLVVTHDSTP